MGKKTYLVGVDGSEFSDRAAERAINLAEKTGAIVHFLAVIQWSKYQPLYLADFEAPPRDTSKEEKLEYQTLLEPLETRYKNSGVEISCELIWGLPTEVIKSKAKSIPANMIFVGRRGRSQALNILLGSVATSVAHTAGVPIVLVP